MGLTDISREALSKKAIELSKAHKNLLLEFATGTGKTKASLDIINAHGGNWLIVVAERAHLKNWTDDIAKHNYNHLLPSIKFVLYASLKKELGNMYYGIVLDEAHNCKSEVRRKALKSVLFNQAILLTATISPSEKRLLELTIGTIHTFKVSLTDAIDANILPVPKIHLHELLLDDVTADQKFTMVKGTPSMRVSVNCTYANRFIILTQYKHVNLTVTCTALQKYNYLCELVEYYKATYMRSRQMGVYNRWLQTASVRKRFIADIKTTAVKAFITTLPPSSRFICFTGSINQCTALGGKSIVHSKIKDPQAIIDKFNDRKTNRLFAVGMLREGVNLVDSDAIIVQLDSKSRSTIQRTGRALRKQFPVIHIFYYKNTIDEVYLNNSIEEFDKFVVRS